MTRIILLLTFLLVGCMQDTYKCIDGQVWVLDNSNYWRLWGAECKTLDEVKDKQ